MSLWAEQRGYSRDFSPSVDDGKDINGRDVQSRELLFEDGWMMWWNEMHLQTVVVVLIKEGITGKWKGEIGIGIQWMSMVTSITFYNKQNSKIEFVVWICFAIYYVAPWSRSIGNMELYWLLVGYMGVEWMSEWLMDVWSVSWRQFDYGTGNWPYSGYK